MHTLNIYRKNEVTGQNEYSHSISQNTRKQCLAIATKKCADMAWDWDDKNHVKRKRFIGDRSTTVSIALSSLLA